MGIETLLLSGKQIIPHIEALAQLRLTVFNEFPYLYNGDMAYEMKYLDTYVKSTRSLMILVKNGDKVIGASTCIPMQDEVSEIQAPYINAGLNISNIFYFGESIILKEYRGQKIGSDFFRLREEYAKEVNKDLAWTSFCAVLRPFSHPLRPEGYKALDHFWIRNGYKAYPEMKVQFKWQDIDKGEEDYKDLMVWMKKW